jgi:small-conductance mechanosensitive channel
MLRALPRALGLALSLLVVASSTPAHGAKPQPSARAAEPQPSARAAEPQPSAHAAEPQPSAHAAEPQPSARPPTAIEKLAKLGSAPAIAASAERPEDALKSSGELVTRAQAALHDLQRVANETTIPPELETLAQELPERRDNLKQRIDAAKDEIRRSRRAAWMRDIRYAFVMDEQQIVAWQADVKDASTTVAAGRARVTELLAFWRRADELARQTDVPAEVREQTARVVAEALHTELLCARPEAVTIPLELTLADMHAMTDSFLRYVNHEGPNLVKEAHEFDFSILGALQRAARLREPWQSVRMAAGDMFGTALLFLTNSRAQVIGHIAILLVVLFTMLSLRSNATAWVGDEREGRIARRVVERPFAATLLLGMVGGIAIYQTVPTLVLVFAYAVATAAALLLFPSLLDPRLLRIGYSLCGFMLLDLGRLFLIDLAPLERMVLLVELVGACVVLSSLLRNWQTSLFAEAHAPRLYRLVAWCWLFGTGVAAFAALVGFGSLAEILGGGVLVSMYLALLFAAAFGAAEGMAWVLTQDRLFGHLHSVKKYRAELVRGFSRLLRWCVLLTWANLSLDYLTLAKRTRRALFAVLNAQLEIGSLHISLGDIVVLVLGAWLAFLVAKVMRFFLEEDVIAHLSVSESTRQVSSLTAYYVILLVGFFFTLAAAGIQLDRLTVLAGAFGVGIGFGLQNVVQNFVAGLLLLFGGPIKIGDKIQIGDLTGEVRAIGFRASTVRTWQGAEVIVPNSKLVADQVVNWTLSDQKRRVDVDIGVEYGTDPERVLALLLEIAGAHAKVLRDPAPSAIFVRHGQSSLDFQLFAWTTFDDSGSVKSELTLAINQRFTREGIGIAFPQQELRIKAVPPELVEALRGAPAKAARALGDDHETPA